MEGCYFRVPSVIRKLEQTGQYLLKLRTAFREQCVVWCGHGGWLIVEGP